LPQLCAGDELIIADDGSTDNTLNLVGQFGAVVRIVAIERIGGVVKNFERVMQSALGDGLVLCDQDDIWFPGRLDLVRSALGKFSLVMLNGLVVNERLESLGITVFDLVDVRRGFWSNFAKNSFVGCCMAMRRDLVELVLPFPVGVPWHDWYIGLVAECTCSVARLHVATMMYRRHGANVSLTGERSRHTLVKKIFMRLSLLWAVAVAVMWRCRGGHHGFDVNG
jgi:glycosyltransferase involved in cell wall biosynthesis